MRSQLVAAALVVALIAGCKTAPPSATSTATPSAPVEPPRAPPSAAAKAATRSNLVAEKVRLSELFRGTPVVFSLQPDGSMRVDVPLRYSFDAGKVVVKPPLAAVLDRIATGQRNEPTLVVVSAPADAAAKGAALVQERSASVHDYLVAHGLADARVSIAAVAVASVVRIVVSEAVQP